MSLARYRLRYPTETRMRHYSPAIIAASIEGSNTIKKAGAGWRPLSPYRPVEPASCIGTRDADRHSVKFHVKQAANIANLSLFTLQYR